MEQIQDCAIHDNNTTMSHIVYHIYRKILYWEEEETCSIAREVGNCNVGESVQIRNLRDALGIIVAIGEL